MGYTAIALRAPNAYDMSGGAVAASSAVAAAAGAAPAPVAIPSAVADAWMANTPRQAAQDTDERPAGIRTCSISVHRGHAACTHFCGGGGFATAAA